jgi:hypothetical protein
MAFDVSLTNPTLIERFEPYFKHPDPNRLALQHGDRAVACKNARTALTWLGFARVCGEDPQSYDHQLSEAVKKFQKKAGNRNKDGIIGPGTRSLLVSKLLEQCGASKFAQLDASEAVRIPTVFLSYTRDDTPRVNKLDQWLRDHGIRVIRDVISFKAGSHIPDNIWESVLSADKVVAVYSQQSKTRDWPAFERQVAEQVEHLIKAPVLIYLRLDDTPLNALDPHRIAIEAQGKTLKQIGLEIQNSLALPVQLARFDYDEDAPL